MANTKITSHVIEANAILSTHIASGAISSGHLSSITSDNVSEGSTNVYHSAARARGTISVTGGNLAYDSSTGVLQLTDAEIRDAISATSSGDGSLTYTSSTGVIAYTGPTASQVQAHLSAGTGVTYSSGAISIGQAVGTGDTVVFGNITTAGYLRGPTNFTIDPAGHGDNTGTLIVAGNLQVDGTTTTINSTTLTVDDLNITLASGAADSAAANGAGITVDGASATLTYASAGDNWAFNKPATVSGSVTTNSGGGNAVLGSHLDLGDNQKARFGASDDLQIYHDGSNSYIDETGTGSLNIRSSATLRLQNSSGTNFLYGTTGGEVVLYHNGIGKLSTLSTGIQVIGTISSGAISATGAANSGSASHLPALLASGSYGGGIATRDTKESGWYQQTNGADWHFYHNRTIASDTPTSKIVLSFNSSGNATFAGTVSSGAITSSGDIKTTGLLEVASSQPRILLDRSDGSYSWNIYNGNGTGNFPTSTFNIANNAGTAVITALDNGNVGIGTTVPAGNLHIVGGDGVIGASTIGGSSNEFIIENNSDAGMTIRSGADGYGVISFADPDDHNTGQVYYNHSNDKMSIITNDAVQMSVDSVGTVDVANDLLANNAKLKAIAESNTDTAVDVFVYDTRKDSDGGAWRKRTQNTSWYNEALNTGTRGARKEFPSVAVIVAESNQITIYDGDDPDMPMWMVFNNSDDKMLGSVPTAAVVKNGALWVSLNGYGVSEINFIKDEAWRHRNNVGSAYYGKWNGGITTRNVSGTFSKSDYIGALVNGLCNDIAVTVLPNAPIDADTGLPVPTIAVATNGGVCVIKDDGTVVDITNTQDSSAFNYIDNLFFRKDGALVWVGDSASNTAAERFLQVLHNLPTSDTNQGTVENSSVIDEQYGPSHKTGSKLRWATTAGVSATSDAGENFAVGTSGALHLLKYNRAVEQEGAIAHITSDYNTGYMLGDIKLATLSDTSTTNVTGGTQPDRSYNNNALTVNGTITKTAVATGADLVKYAFGANNYLKAVGTTVPTSTNDACYIWWSIDGSADRSQIYLGDISSTEAVPPYGINVWSYAGMKYRYAGSQYNTTTGQVTEGVWNQHCMISRNGIFEVFINGKFIHRASSGHNGITETDLYIGKGHYNNAHSLGMALFRVSATAPTEEQIKKMYNDEKHLFSTNAKATLYGTSDAVTALAYDDDTELLHAGTSAGRSVFQGLNRVNNTTDAVGTAISASNGFIVED